MNHIKLTLKYLLRGLECFLAFLFLYLTIVIGGQLSSIGQLQNSGDVKIYVRSNGVHTELCFPTNTEYHDWSTFIPTEHFPQQSDFQYVSIGWGDKGFFLDTPTWDDLTFKTAFNAAFLPSPTAMHVAYSKEVQECETCVATYLSKENYLVLIKHIQQSFRLKKKSVDLITGKGYGVNDNFYEADGSYHLFRTCNTWTNNCLKVAKIRTARYALFQDGIMDFLRFE